MNDSVNRITGQGREHGEIPHGIEILVKKAAVDAVFHQALLEKRSKAAQEMGLELAPAEVAMLDSIPIAQIEAIIENTQVPEKQRRAFLGDDVAKMRFAITSSCQCQECRQIFEDVMQDSAQVTRGIRPDFPRRRSRKE